MNRYLVFKHKVMSLSDEDEEHVSISVYPESDIMRGLVVPRSNPLIYPDPVGVVEAKDKEEAAHKYLASIEEMFI